MKVLFIVGPTGVGKTALALEVAEKFKGRLVSADSVQVYRGLDIISGKDLPISSQFTVLKNLSQKKFNPGFYLQNGIPIFLLDVVFPTFSFSVNDFKYLASKYIRFIGETRKIPIVIGGTGLYVKSLIDGFESDLIKPDLDLRRELDKLGVWDLQKILQGKDKLKFEMMNKSDVNNKRRLIRAIEKVNSKTQKVKIENGEEKYESLVIGLSCKREVLKNRIAERVESRLKNGALDEAERLFKNYENLVLQVKSANGYKQLFQYLKKEVSFDEAIYRWKISEYHHAKNQMTWFGKYGSVEWFDIEKNDFKKKIAKKIKEFLL